MSDAKIVGKLTLAKASRKADTIGRVTITPRA